MYRKRCFLVALSLFVALPLFLVGCCGIFDIPPTIRIQANPVVGKAPLEVQFSVEQTDGNGVITSCVWNFGDGATGSGLLVTHIYEVSGVFTASATVTDNHDKTGSANQTINVLNPGPTCEGIYVNMTGDACISPFCKDDALRFSAKNPGHPESGRYIEEYKWNFGDGTTGYGNNALHSYSQSGTYTVTLTLTDDLGVSNQFQTSFSIQECCYCLPEIYIERDKGCLNAGCAVTFCGRFGDGCCGNYYNAEELKAKLDVKSSMGPESCCSPYPSCPSCPPPCQIGRCLGGVWEWCIFLNGESIGSGRGRCITVTPCSGGTLTVSVYYTCGNKSTYATEEYHIKP